MSAIDKVFQRTNKFHKLRLAQKFILLVSRRVDIITGDKTKIKWRYMITDLTGTLKSNEFSLLSKGPKFAFSIEINNRLKYDICLSTEIMTWHNRHPFQFGITWYPANKYISQSACDNPELEQKLKSCFAKFSKSWTKKAKKASQRIIVHWNNERWEIRRIPSVKRQRRRIVCGRRNEKQTTKIPSSIQTIINIYEQVKRMSVKTMEDI